MTTSKRGVRKTERIIEAEDYTDGSHPAGGNFVLMDKGRAWYGGVLYTRADKASVTFLETDPEPVPENKFKPGDTVKVLTDEFKGNENKGSYPFGEEELELYVGLKVNDRVVYTPPATYLGYPGTEFATPGLVGELGTVTEVSPASAPVVRWDNAGSLRHASEFLAPAPTHRHPEGLYQSGGTRVIVYHGSKDETYDVLYIDNALAGHPEPVNRGMTKVTELGYTLVTEFKA